ncbi:hypothetical protein A3Q56_00102 [Intoshia linei]|uniref:Uncharacterized protein n=1 Tax=Intoshia linei TaxID=1819745 RepID=A0A177BCS9_9BILA|nr:hypothetical protein A3Q56_00102 [Intoshia linei]
MKKTELEKTIMDDDDDRWAILMDSGYDHHNFDIDFDNAVLLTNELICKTALTEDDQKYQKKLYAKIMDKEDHVTQKRKKTQIKYRENIKKRLEN